MAFVGWYLKKRNWLSLLILSPMICDLTIQGVSYTKLAVLNFPSHLIAVIFCFAQILLYLYAFFDDIKQRLAGLALAVIVIAVIIFFKSTIDVSVNMDLPDEPSFSDSAVISLKDSSYGNAEILDAKEGYVSVHMTKYGSTVMTVTDGDKTYEYNVEAKMIDNINQIEITKKEK
ncbi:MAG: hypothetical protein IJV39_03115 [Ruminococcus sp.]|nr:hypothetical protein [Ruminococcus sp.]